MPVLESFMIDLVANTLAVLATIFQVFQGCGQKMIVQCAVVS